MASKSGSAPSPKILINISKMSSALWKAYHRNYWDIVYDVVFPGSLCGETLDQIEEKANEIEKQIEKMQKKNRYKYARWYIYVGHNSILSFLLFKKLMNHFNFAFPIVPDDCSLKNFTQYWDHVEGWRIIEAFGMVEDEWFKKHNITFL